MPAVRFIIEDMYDIPGRDGILTTGRLVSGVIHDGTVLRNESTGRQARVLGLEFLTPRQEGTDRRTLRIDRADRTALAEGAVLTSVE